MAVDSKICIHICSVLQIHKSDLDLATLMMEQEIERIIKDLSDKSDSFLADGKIRDVCHKYKASYLVGANNLPQPNFAD